MRGTQENRNALSTLGVVYEETPNGEFLYDFTFEGEYFQDEYDLVWCGLFGFSRTGLPQDELYNFWKVLGIFNESGYIDSSLQIYAYILHRFGFTDYSFNICKQDLTERGKALYLIMEQELQEFLTLWHE
jgi:hypothetical protein